MPVDNQVMKAVSDFLAELKIPGSKAQQALTNLENAILDEKERIHLLIEQFQKQNKELENAQQAEAERLLYFCLKEEKEALREESERLVTQQLKEQEMALQANDSFYQMVADLYTQRDTLQQEVQTAAKEMAKSTAEFYAASDAAKQLHLTNLDTVAKRGELGLTTTQTTKVREALEKAPPISEVIEKGGANVTGNNVATNTVMRAVFANGGNPLSFAKKLDAFIKLEMDKQTTQPTQAYIKKAKTSYKNALNAKKVYEEKSAQLNAVTNRIEGKDPVKAVTQKEETKERVETRDKKEKQLEDKITASLSNQIDLVMAALKNRREEEQNDEVDEFSDEPVAQGAELPKSKVLHVMIVPVFCSFFATDSRESHQDKQFASNEVDDEVIPSKKLGSSASS